MSNLLFKTATVAALGDRRLIRRIALSFSVAVGVGLLLLGVW
jgi:hypothetical protein